jgi:hypothetical protein
VIPPANTGRDNSKRTDVIKIDHKYKGILNNSRPSGRIYKMVTIKLMAPAIEETPAICKLKIVKSTAAPGCAKMPDKGGYTVQPVPVPKSTMFDKNKKENDGGINQKLILFKRGKAISGAPKNMGTNQLPKPLIKIGINIKKIIINACAVTTTLYNW